MTERDLYVSCIPMIAEMAIRRREMSEREYEDWKCETMEYCRGKAKEFIKKVFVVIDSVILKSSEEI